MSSAPTPSGAAAIDLVNVTRKYGGIAVVNDLTLSVPRGALLGFIGLNGAGKSTTIRMAVGLLRPTSGSIRVADCDVVRDHVELCRRIGYVPDRPNIYGWMRVGEAIEFVRKLHTRWNTSRCEDLTRRFKLPLDKRVDRLSKGQAAKLQLLLAVCHDPSVLILDEPTSGFDPIVREEFLENVLRVAGEREQTVLFSSHSLADVQRLADRIAVLHEGRLVLNGTTDELLQRIKRVRMVFDDDQAIPPTICEHLLRQTHAGREHTITLDHFAPSQVEALRASPGVRSLDVFDLSLDDIFKDLIRGKEEATCL